MRGDMDHLTASNCEHSLLVRIKQRFLTLVDNLIVIKEKLGDLRRERKRASILVRESIQDGRSEF